MANPKPKAKQANADAHRQDDDDDDDDQETADIPGSPAGDGALGGDGGGGGGGGTMGGGSGGMSIPNINTRTLVMVGIGLLAAYAAYKYVSGTDAKQVLEQNTSEEVAETEPGDEIEVERDDTVDGVQIPDDPEDPLKADHEAGKYIFGWGDDE
jgi:hypothetical protein